ncbi:SANT domain-containing protein [Aphelenchoides fujianensis]|nr:SANT domain-containing protein [Aphelenchoides fujianensis]
MGLSRRSIVFGRGKRMPSSDEPLDPPDRPFASTIGLSESNPIRSTSCSPTRLMIAESGEEESKDAPPNASIGSPEPAPVDTKKSTAAKRKAGTNWNTEEAMAFYDGIKEHGKNFEQIVATLARKKFSKDKDQVRNFYYNTYKMYKEKAGIEEREWTNVPHTARELLVIINTLEWRKKTHTTTVNPIRFKALIMTGSTNQKVAGKRVPVSIRTPNCAALHKFFPSMKQSAKVPTTLQVQLTPYTYAARRFVMNCEQNPLLSITLNTHCGLSYLFRFLEQKWTLPERKSHFGMNDSSVPTILLYPPEGFKPTKITVQPADDAHPSVNSLRADCESRQAGASAANGPSTSSDAAGPSTPQGVSNAFDQFDETFANGLTTENSANINFLQLYFAFGQQPAIRLRYEVISNVRSTNVFVKLSELIRNSEGIADLAKNRRRPIVLEHFGAVLGGRQAAHVHRGRRRPNGCPTFRMASTQAIGNTDVVDRERALFKQQLLELRQKPAKGTEIPCEPQRNRLRIVVQQQKRDEPVLPSTHSIFEDVVNSELSRNTLQSPSKSMLEAAYSFYDDMQHQDSNHALTSFSELVHTVNSDASHSFLDNM